VIRNDWMSSKAMHSFTKPFPLVLLYDCFMLFPHGFISYKSSFRLISS
jgi:hypothetical protein